MYPEFIQRKWEMKKKMKNYITILYNPYNLFLLVH